MYEEFYQLGLTRFHHEILIEEEIDISLLARVVSASHENYLLQFPQKQTFAKIAGKMRFAAHSASDFPVVGDWVLCSNDSERLITRLLPRSSFLSRSAVGRLDQQILAANLDSVVIVMSADRDFNLARLERYLALIFVQNIVPVVFLNKTDLIDKDTLNWLEADLFKRHPGLTVFSGSVLKEEGLKAFADGLTPGRSFCVVGSSGVGKSSLINYLAQNEVERIKEIGAGTQRGRHTTTSGHMHILDKGAILIDTPGLREVGLTDAEDGIKKAFAEIEELAMNCRFSDCKHQSEPGCAVQEALSEGRILPEKFSNYQKLKREAERFGQTIADKRKKEKSFGRMVKEVKKMKKNKL